MPKLNPAVTLSSTALTDIQAQVSRIELMLDGKIEDDNVFNDGEKYVVMQPKKVVNMADETRPVTGFKFFSSLTDTNFETESQCSFVFNNSNMEIVEIDDVEVEKLSFGERALDKAGDMLQSVGKLGGVFDSSSLNLFEQAEEKLNRQRDEYLLKYKGRESWERRIIKLRKTPFIKPMTSSDVSNVFTDGISTADTFIRRENEYFMSITYFTDVEVAALLNNFKVEIMSESPELIEIAVYLSTVGFDKDDYFTLQIGVEVLCKEVL